MSDKTFFLSILLLTGAILVMGAIASRGVPVVVQTNLENLPLRIDGYTAVRDDFPQSVYDVLRADKHVYRHYRTSAETVIDLYIGYYGTAKGGRTGHNPYACLPGAGWGVVRNEKIPLFVEYADTWEDVNYTVTQKGDRFMVMLHWYQSGGTRILDAGLKQNVHRFVSRITRNRNDGAYIQISMQVEENGVEPALAAVRRFAERMIVLLPAYWPVEKEI